jgi:NADPH-dependent curcumin reductase CurA
MTDINPQIVVHGLDAALPAFIGLLRGANVGTLLVKL